MVFLNTTLPWKSLCSALLDTCISSPGESILIFSEVIVDVEKPGEVILQAMKLLIFEISR
jgi:hypothetical protein